MVPVGAVAVSGATVLARVRISIAAGAVLLGAVPGPRSLVATPVHGSLVAANFGDAVLWWHAKGQLVVAALATAVTAPLVPSAQHGPGGVPPQRPKLCHSSAGLPGRAKFPH
jgi:hypothetical protein